MNDRHTYKATAHREGGWWVVVVHELEDGNTSQARRIDQLEQVVRELVVLAADLPDDASDSFDVQVDIDLPDDLAAEVADVRAAQEAAERARRESAERARSLVARLRHDLRLSLRDVGQVLGVSHQRAQQMASRLDG